MKWSRNQRITHQRLVQQQRTGAGIAGLHEHRQTRLLQIALPGLQFAHRFATKHPNFVVDRGDREQKLNVQTVRRFWPAFNLRMGNGFG